MRINKRNHGARWSIILDSTQMRELAEGDEDLIADMITSAAKWVSKRDTSGDASSQ